MADKKRRIIKIRKRYERKDWFYCRESGGFIHRKACLNRHLNPRKYKNWNACEYCFIAISIKEQEKNKSSPNESTRRIIRRPKPRRIIRRRK